MRNNVQGGNVNFGIKQVRDLLNSILVPIQNHDLEILVRLFQINQQLLNVRDPGVDDHDLGGMRLGSRGDITSMSG